MLAFLIGCRELSRLDGYKALIEGDSFLAIQWGLGKCSHPSRIVDWVEEVHDISQKLDVQFHHIQREANVMADSLAREGVFLLLFLLMFYRDLSPVLTMFMTHHLWI